MMFSLTRVMLAATLLNQLVCSSGFILPTSTKGLMVDTQLATSESLQPGIPEDVGVEEGSHEELLYSLGVNLARQLGDIRPLVENSEELTHVAKGLLDTVIGRLNDEAQRNLLSKRGKELDQLIMERATNLREKLEKAGRDMLDNMKDTEGVKELEGGVLLHLLEHGPDGEGKGMRPTVGSTVSIHYHGTLPDGTVFDSTLGKEPIKLPIANVIPGWRIGVLQMHEGETAMLGIPPEQAYGAEGTPDGRIPGGSTLIQLLEILTGGIGGEAKLLGVDGKELGKDSASSGLLGVDGKPI